MGEPPMTDRYVCVHVPEIAAQALIRLRPDLAQTPVVVLQGEPPLEQVYSVNARARRLGVRGAMTRAELDSFDGFCILRRSAAEERNAQSALLVAAGAFTPRVQMQPVRNAAWAMVLDMTGSSCIFGPIKQVVERILQTMKSLNFSTRVAVSSNFHAAVCMASSANRTTVIIPDGEEARSLAHLPLAALGLTTQQDEVFALWGLHTLGELASLPEVDLIVRLGQEGKRLRMLARGEHPHLMVPEEEAFELNEFLELDSPVELLDSLLFVLGPMIGQLIARAQNHAFALSSVSVRFGLDGGGEHQRTIKPAQPVADRELLLKLLHLDLQAHPPPAGVVAVSVSAEPGERSKVQIGLFSPQLPDPTRLDVTLARIAALVGEDRVGRARLQDNHKPESFVMERFVVQPAQDRTTSHPNRSIALRRYRPPLVIHMRQQGEQLKCFYLHGVCYLVEQAYGPWRKSGTWWSSQVWSAEEWDVQAATADKTLLCLVSHDLLCERWQLEALYD